MNALVVMIGPPGCGKSTWTAKRFSPTQIVSLDSLRGWVSDDSGDQRATADAVAIAHLILAARCRRRLLTAVDATNVRVDVRDELLALARQHRMIPIAVVLDTPLATCIERDAARAHPVGREVIERMYAQHPEPGPINGFTQTRRIAADGNRVFGATPPEFAHCAVWLR